MLLVIDNYDSFTYNLVQYLGELGEHPEVRRNDQTDVAQLERLAPEAIVISPGPCTPKEAGISNDVIRSFSGRVPLLGVCLGHQCIGYVFGAKIIKAPKIMHGKTSLIYHDKKGIFQGLKGPLREKKYHPLVVVKKT